MVRKSWIENRTLLSTFASTHEQLNQAETDIATHLVNRCRTGDRHAQNEIYKMYARPMFNVSLRILQNREEAEDILQESFIDAFTKINSFRGESSFGSWFKRIVINKSINRAKRSRVLYSELNDTIAEDTNEDDETGPPEQRTVEMVREAIKELPDGFRIVFSLYSFEDYSHKQIADTLGITESTSKSQLNRARKKIAEIIRSKYQ
jgi:RNA polymerase sigma factor (sigma-70 family)